MTVGHSIIAALKRGKSNADTLAAVRSAHPGTTVSVATISWYRRALRRDGHKVPHDRECRKARKG